ncbi:MAG TPA: hypothetical protein VLV49_00055 [Terriglobales bacterium]|nr:hypothetical protein [Terriglobales bacterium]
MHTSASRTQDRSRRAWLLLGVAAFAGGFQIAYVGWLNPVFGYFGFGNNDPSWRYLLLAWTLSVLPGLWMPIHLTRPSQLIYWVIFLSVYVPSMFVPLYASLDGPAAVVKMLLTLFVGLFILGLAHRLPPRQLHPPRLSPGAFRAGFGWAAAALVLWVVVVFHGRLQIVSFAEVYDVRFAAEDVMEGSLVNYALMWLTAVIGPCLLVWGLFRRRPLLFAAGGLIQLLVYGAVGAKAALASLVVIPFFYLLLRKNTAAFGLKLVWGTALAFFLLYLGRSWGDASENLFYWALSLVFMRTFGMPGLLTEWYREFFQRNPLTYYSHLKVVNSFLHYPYANPLGIEVGWFFSGEPTLDANAHFWATDGLAALGLPGVVLVSVLCALLFWALDSAAAKHDVRFSALLVSFAAINLANVSMFTTLLSGGLGLLMLVLYCQPTVSWPAPQARVKLRPCLAPGPPPATS